MTTKTKWHVLTLTSLRHGQLVEHLIHSKAYDLSESTIFLLLGWHASNALLWLIQNGLNVIIYAPTRKCILPVQQCLPLNL